MENNAKRMADLLRSGYKMLNIACPECNNPIFKDRSNNMFCPICNRKVMFENQTDVTMSKEVDDETIVNPAKKSENLENLLAETKIVLIEKYHHILEKLSNEFQINHISRYIKILERILEFLKRTN